MIKKIVGLACAIGILCVCQTFAQSNLKLPREVMQAFGSEFINASNLRWEKVSEHVFLVRFNNSDLKQIAYFDSSGKLLMTGELLCNGQARESIMAELGKIKTSYERKFGPMMITQIYQLNERGITRYYTNMGNDKLLLSVISSQRGSTRIVKKVHLNLKGDNELFDRSKESPAM